MMSDNRTGRVRRGHRQDMVRAPSSSSLGTSGRMEEDIATAGSPALLLVHSRVIGMEWNQQMVRACPMKAFTNLFHERIGDQLTPSTLPTFVAVSDPDASSRNVRSIRREPSECLTSTP